MGGSVVAVVHGKSEAILCRKLERSTRCRICVFSEKEGEACISLRSLPEVMSARPFRNESDLHREFEDLDYDPRRRPMMPDLRIITVVDTDDSPHDVQAYVTGNLLRSCPLSDSIVPIYNTPNLDAVFESHGFLVDRRNKAGSYKAISRRLDFLELYRLLKEDDSTNLDVFIRHVLSKVPELQNKVDPGIV